MSYLSDKPPGELQVLILPPFIKAKPFPFHGHQKGPHEQHTVSHRGKCIWHTNYLFILFKTKQKPCETYVGFSNLKTADAGVNTKQRLLENSDITRQRLLQNNDSYKTATVTKQRQLQNRTYEMCPPHL